MITKLLVAGSAAAVLIATTGIEANARTYHRHTYNRSVAPQANYSRGLGLRKQTRTGGPAGGQTNGGGGD